MAGKSQFEIISRVHGKEIAQVIKAHLESEGIPALLKYESGSTVLPTLVDNMGEVQVLVSKSREQEALEVLKTD